MTNSLNSGFKINYRRSQIFDGPMMVDALREEIEEAKDESSIHSESMK